MDNNEIMELTSWMMPTLIVAIIVFTFILILLSIFFPKKEEEVEDEEDDEDEDDEEWEEEPMKITSRYEHLPVEREVEEVKPIFIEGKNKFETKTKYD